jgi:hypothetical protein
MHGYNTLKRRITTVSFNIEARVIRARLETSQEKLLTKISFKKMIGLFKAI